MVVSVVVNGSFGGGGGSGFVLVLVVASRCYVFCGFSSMSLLLMEFSNTWVLDSVACLRCDYMGF